MKNIAIPERTLVHNHSKGEFSALKLEEVRDYLRKLETRQNPIDYVRLPKTLDLNFEARPFLGYLTDNTLSHGLMFSTTGLSQAASSVLPGHFFKGLKQLIAMDPEGAKLASSVWAKFAKHRQDKKKFRVISMRLNNEVYRVIRSVVSEKYAVYSNLQFVEDLLADSETRKMPVLDWKVTDNAMRIRFATMDDLEYALSEMEPEYRLKRPIPMIEAWNSEVGQRSVVMKAGFYRLVSGAGLGFWSDANKTAWRHYGSTHRLRSKVTAANAELIEKAEGLIQLYAEAEEIEISDPKGWMTAFLSKEKSINQRTIDLAVKLLQDPSNAESGTLACAVDALTLAALKETSLFYQSDVEQVAGKMLHAGIKIAAKNDGTIPKKDK